jgi:dienelactone hydrolase
MSETASLHYIAFPTLHETPLTVAARLRLPEGGAEKRPAVIILHGSAGPSGREGGYAKVLNEAGFATLEPDQWAARGLKGGADGRPRTVAETLPDLYGARRFLAGHPRIDAAQIGVMGFSFGGVASMLAATRAYNNRFLPDAHFAAYMPVYPVCWLYNRAPGYEFRDLVAAPVLIVTGALDQYDNDPKASENLVAALPDADRARVRTLVMADAHHAFDMPGVDIQAKDPSSHRGEGGLVTMRYNPMATAQVHKACVAFFSDAMK